MSKTKTQKTSPKLKNLSAPLVLILAILDAYGKEGAYLSDVVNDYQELGINISRRSICTYLHRVCRSGYAIDGRECTDGRWLAIYRINKDGIKELSWWRSAIN